MGSVTARNACRAKSVEVFGQIGPLAGAQRMAADTAIEIAPFGGAVGRIAHGSGHYAVPAPPVKAGFGKILSAAPSSGAPAIDRNTRIGVPDTLGRYTRLSEDVGRDDAARIPAGADPEPFGIQKRDPPPGNIRSSNPRRTRRGCETNEARA